jgi:Ni,Fe-hydrogenase I cytochrome b subunit
MNQIRPNRDKIILRKRVAELFFYKTWHQRVAFAIREYFFIGECLDERINSRSK